MTAHGFAGVIGWPLDATLSPAIHNAAFRRLGLDWVYLALPVPPDRLEDAVRGLRALGAVAANVTIPHKETCIPYLDEVSGDARAIGAVNTIQRVGDRLVGHNTDIDGFKEFVVGDAGVAIERRSALVLGSGGAARAVVKALADLGAASIVVAARDEDAASEVAKLGGGAVRSAPLGSIGAGSDADVVVNAIPVDDPAPSLEWGPGKVAIDLRYLPPVTPFMERARREGSEAWGGIGMLVRQAAASLKIWTGQDPPTAVMSAAAVHAIGSSGSTRAPTLPK